MTAYVKAAAKHLSVRCCHGCGANRLCRKYGHGQTDVLWLCVDGPAHCWRHRKAIRDVRRRAAA